MMWYRKAVLIMIVTLGLAALGTFFSLHSRYFRREIKSCFNDVQGLHEGASVRIAGVNVGWVRTVQAKPRDKNCPAEVEMLVSTPYELNIPRDAITSIAQGGILGPPFVIIETNYAVGPPIENYGYLKSKPTLSQTSLPDALKALETVVKSAVSEKPAALVQSDSPEAPPPKPH